MFLFSFSSMSSPTASLVQVVSVHLLWLERHLLIIPVFPFPLAPLTRLVWLHLREGQLSGILRNIHAPHEYCVGSLPNFRGLFCVAIHTIPHLILIILFILQHNTLHNVSSLWTEDILCDSKPLQFNTLLYQCHLDTHHQPVWTAPVLFQSR